MNAMATTPVPSEASVVLCCGTGGVGKTTTAAALALSAARQGRRVVVVTIDPARRLADALDLDGIDGIDDECVFVPIAGSGGELWVTMLDTKATFDRLIGEYATSQAQAERILANNYYRNLSTSLSGTREFMAMERLYELYNDDRFDLVVVDTPPSRSALDFLDAPNRLSRFLDGRLFKLASPTGRVARKVSAPILVLLRRIARVISPEVVDDTLAFMEAFAGMEAGFSARAGAVDELLRRDTTAFVLVTTPSAEAVEESHFLADNLEASSMRVTALVANRLQPRFTARTSAELGDDTGSGEGLAILRDLTALAEAQDVELAPLLESCSKAQILRVEQLEHDVHDLEGIGRVADLLDGRA